MVTRRLGVVLRFGFLGLVLWFGDGFTLKKVFFVIWFTSGLRMVSHSFFLCFGLLGGWGWFLTFSHEKTVFWCFGFLGLKMVLH